MTQTDLNVANASGAAVRADINAHLDAMVSLSSGTTAPATTFPNQWWLDTSTNILKQRDNANTAWVNAVSKPGTNWIPYRNGVLLGTAATKSSATESAEGTAEIATQVETDAGTDDIRFVTPLKLANFPVGGGFAAGTRMLFQQTAAPSGWTKETVHNNKAMRLQTGAVTTGGANPFTTVFGTGKITASHTLSTSQIAAHTHDVHTASDLAEATDRVRNSTRDSGAGADVTGAALATGGGGSHTHNLSNLDLQFVDFIIAVKD